MTAVDNPVEAKANGESADLAGLEVTEVDNGAESLGAEGKGEGAGPAGIQVTEVDDDVEVAKVDNGAEATEAEAGAGAGSGGQSSVMRPLLYNTLANWKAVSPFAVLLMRGNSGVWSLLHAKNSPTAFHRLFLSILSKRLTT